MPLDLSKYEKYKESPEEKTSSSGLELSKYEKYKSTSVPSKEEKTSTIGAFGEHFAYSLPSSAAALAGAGAAMTAAAPVAAAAGPFAPVVEAGAAIMGGLAAGYTGAKIEEAVTPEAIKQGLARSKEEHPYAAFGGEVSSNLPFMGIGQASKVLRGTLGLLGAGQEAVREEVSGEDLSPAKMAMAGAAGAALTKPTTLGGKIAPAFKTPATKEVPPPVEEPIKTETPTRKQELKAIVEEQKRMAVIQEKKDQAREVLDLYPEVQSATSGKQAATRKKLEKYMADPEVMRQIKTIQDTEAAFKEAEVPRRDLMQLQLKTRQNELVEAVNRGAPHSEIIAKKESIDRVMTNVLFPGVSREEASSWIADMKARQEVEIQNIVSQEKKPKTISEAGIQGNRLSLKDPITQWDYRAKANLRTIMQGVGRLLKIAPDEAKQLALFNKAENPLYAHDPDVKVLKELNKEVWEAANKQGIVAEWVDNYLTHMYAPEGRTSSETKAQIARITEEVARAPTSGMGTRSRFADPRVFKTYEDAFKHAGLKPLTTNPAEIYQVYANSMFQAANNKQFLSEIKNIVNPATGEKLIVDSKKADPRNYETINHPQFIGKAVAKDIAPTVRSMFESPSSSVMLNGVHLASMLAKKGIFSLSAFHIKSLGDAFIGALRNPKQVMQIPSLFKQWKEGGAGDLVDLALKGGLEIGHQPLDTHADVLKGIINDVSSTLDRAFPKLGNTVRLPAAAVEGLNKFLWEYVHPSLKLATWAANHEKLVAQGIDPVKASEMAATFTNDIFGGLNWRRIAENTNSYLGSRIANEAASKGGQRAMQVGLLAPDWTVATARSWEGAFRGAGTGKVSPQERAMYQRYLLQSGLIYAGVADLLNIQFTGHHFWENKDPTMVEMEDGRRIQLSKHFMEVPHWFLHPNQTMLNKIGYVPSEIFRQALNQDYLSASGASPRIVEKGEGMGQELLQRTAHAAKGMSPISVQAAAMKVPEEAFAGAAGFPVYGDTPEKRMERKRILQQKKMEIRRKMAEK